MSDFHCNLVNESMNPADEIHQLIEYLCAEIAAFIQGAMASHTVATVHVRDQEARENREAHAFIKLAARR